MALKKSLEKGRKLDMIYEYSNEILKEELDRFDRIEKKATLYFTIMSALIGVFVIFVNNYISNFIHPDNCIKIIFFILIFVVTICLLVETLLSWFELLESIKFRKLFNRPLNDKFLAWAKGKSIQEIEDYFIRKNSEAIIKNKKEKEIKIRSLESAHGHMKKIMVLIFILLILLFIDKVIFKILINA